MRGLGAEGAGLGVTLQNVSFRRFVLRSKLPQKPNFPFGGALTSCCRLKRSVSKRKYKCDAHWGARFCHGFTEAR